MLIVVVVVGFLQVEKKNIIITLTRSAFGHDFRTVTFFIRGERVCLCLELGILLNLGIALNKYSANV